jgi:hypothetical protein
VNLTAYNDISIVHRTKLNSIFGTRIIFEHSANYNSNNAFAQYLDSEILTAGQQFNTGIPSYNTETFSPPDTNFHTHSIVLNRAAAPSTEQTFYYRDGVHASEAQSDDLLSNNFGNHVLYLFARAASSLYLSAEFRGFFLLASAVSNEDRAKLESTESGVGIPFEEGGGGGGMNFVVEEEGNLLYGEGGGLVTDE